MPHVSGVNIERTSTRVHGCEQLGVYNVLECKFSNIVPVLIVCMLSQQGDGTLSVIYIKLGHVQIIYEVDKFLFAGWTKLLTSDLLQELF